jgi:hypothetical protein
LRLLRSKQKWIVVGVFALGTAVGAGIAIAAVTNPRPTVDTNVVRERIVFSQFTPDAAQPEFSSGWHTHPGPAIVQVQEGYLKSISAATCHPVVIGPGETYIETPELPLIVTANHAARWTTTLILPNSAPGAPDRTAASDPC